MIKIILAVPRPKQLKRILPQLAQFGVSQLVLLRSWNVQRQYLTSKALNPEVYQPLLEQGLLQARLTEPPLVTYEPRFVDFVENRLPEADMGLVGHPETSVSLSSIRPKGTVALAIGPEGGWTDDEIGSFGRAGYRAVSMGPTHFRVETATVALLAQLHLLRRL